MRLAFSALLAFKIFQVGALPTASSTFFKSNEKAVLFQSPEPYLVVNITDAILRTSDLDYDSFGCLLKTRSSKLFLEVNVAVNNIGSVDYNNPPSVGILNCGMDYSALKFFNISFPGGPYFPHAKCISDHVYTCTNMGISSGSTYSTVFYVKIKPSVLSSYYLSTFPLVVSVSSFAMPNSIPQPKSLPYYVSISYPTSLPTSAPIAVVNSSTLMGLWVGNFYTTDVLDSSQFGYLSFTIATTLYAVLQLNNGALQTGGARLYIFGDVIFAYITYSGIYQGILVRQNSNNADQLVGKILSLQQGLDFGASDMFLNKAIASQPNTQSVSSPTVVNASSLVGVWVGNFNGAEAVDCSQLGYVSLTISSSLYAVLQLNNGDLRTGAARLLIFGDVILAYITYSGIYQGILVRQDSTNADELVGKILSLQQGLDFAVNAMYLKKIIATVPASFPAAFNSSTLMGLWAGNFYSTDVVDSSQLGYLSFNIATTLYAVLQLNNGAMQTGGARLFIFGDVIFAYITYSGIYQGILVRQNSNNADQLVGKILSLQQGLDFGAYDIFLNKAIASQQYTQPTSSPTVVNASSLVGVWVGNFNGAEAVDSSQLGYVSVTIASSLYAVLQLNNGDLRTGAARLLVFGDVIFAYITYSGIYQGILVRQDSSNSNQLVGSLFSLQQGLDFGVNNIFLVRLSAGNF